MKIMFNHSYGLHDATIQGTKTQTMRFVPQKWIDDYDKWYADIFNVSVPPGSRIATLEEQIMRLYQYHVGQVLPIAECYSDIYNRMVFTGRTDEAFAFRAKLGAEPELQVAWRNKTFVREELMPTAIRIDFIRFQSLQDISDEDCLAEGIVDEGDIRGHYRYGFYTGLTFEAKGIRTTSGWYKSQHEAYAGLIDKIGKCGDWNTPMFTLLHIHGLNNWE